VGLFKRACPTDFPDPYPTPCRRKFGPQNKRR
jgi:hypothetical protein